MSRSADTRRTAASVAAILAVAAALRLIHANTEFWFDEIVTVTYYVPVPLHRIVTTYFANNHVLNSILVHVMASLAGVQPWAVRLPAIAFGVGAVWAFWFVAHPRWPRVPALVGTLLFAASFYGVYYSQNARGYTAFLFFGLLATGCLLRSLECDRPRRWRYALGYSLAIGLGLYAMLLTTFIVAGHACALVAWRRWRALVWLASGVAVGGLLYAPMAAELIDYYRRPSEETGYRLLSGAFAGLLAPIAVGLAAGVALAAPLVWRLVRRQPLMAALLFLPLVFNVAVPLLRGQGVYPRSFVFGLAVAYLLLVEAIDWALDSRPILAWSGALLVGAISIVQLVPYYRLPKQGFRQALAFVEQHRSPGDERVGLTMGGKAAQYYDPSITLIQDADQLRAWMGRARHPAWIVSTFPRQMRLSNPDLFEWLSALPSKAEFRGVVGDGSVYVHYWAPPRH